MGALSEARLELPPEPASVRAARAFVADALAGTPADDCADDARLLVSELVTNALLHARSPLEVVVRLADGLVRVEVRDEVDHLPAVMTGPEPTMAGRGLLIVQELSDGWGAEPLGAGGKTVWFELSYA